MAKTLTRKEMAKQIAEELGENTKQIDLALSMFLDMVKKQTAAGERVRLNGFGSFSVRENAERKINPFGKGEQVIPATKKVKFTASKEFNV